MSGEALRERRAGRARHVLNPPRGGSGVYSNRPGSQNGNPGQEVKVLATALPAEYGHSRGGIVNIACQGGTKELPGLAEERDVSKPIIHRYWPDPVATYP